MTQLSEPLVRDEHISKRHGNPSLSLEGSSQAMSQLAMSLEIMVKASVYRQQ